METVYQLTQSTALACSQIHASDELAVFAFLEKWQDLCGAFLGGLMGVVGALLVARNSIRRERRLAAQALVVDLIRVHASAISQGAFASSQPMGTETLLAQWLAHDDLELPALHGAWISQLSDIDGRLTTHLALCEALHRELRPRLRRFAELDRVGSSEEKKLENSAATIKTQWLQIVDHARLANYYLNGLVLRRRPVWVFRLRVRIAPNHLDRMSRRLAPFG